jgi:hypothetical protein
VNTTLLPRESRLAKSYGNWVHHLAPRTTEWVRPPLASKNPEAASRIRPVGTAFDTAELREALETPAVTPGTARLASIHPGHGDETRIQASLYAGLAHFGRYPGSKRAGGGPEHEPDRDTLPALDGAVVARLPRLRPTAAEGACVRRRRAVSSALARGGRGGLRGARTLSRQREPVAGRLTCQIPWGERGSAMTEPESTIATTGPLDAGELERLRTSLATEGVDSIARRSGASVSSVVRAAAGLALRPGTRAIIVAVLTPPDGPEAA